MMKFNDWVASVVKALKGASDDLSGLSQKQAKTDEKVTAMAEYAAGLNAKVDNAVTELKRLADFTVGLAKTVEALPVAGATPDLLQQIKEINDVLSNLPELK
jgi:ABC-type transporter Mla subunit MlaD